MTDSGILSDLLLFVTSYFTKPLFEPFDGVLLNYFEFIIIGILF